MATNTARWTADDLDRLPDDGNKYEVVDGRLLVTPAPAPSHELVIDALVAEVLSPTSHRHDLVWKRDLYRREEVPVAWVVDHEERRVHVVQPGVDDVVATDELVWQPSGAAAALTIELPAFFRRALLQE